MNQGKIISLKSSVFSLEWNVVFGWKRNCVADRPQGLNEGFLMNIDVLQCMVSWHIDVR